MRLAVGDHNGRPFDHTVALIDPFGSQFLQWHFLRFSDYFLILLAYLLARYYLPFGPAIAFLTERMGIKN